VRADGGVTEFLWLRLESLDILRGGLTPSTLYLMVQNEKLWCRKMLRIDSATFLTQQHFHFAEKSFVHSRPKYLDE
jgi:hypothetical protein